MTEELKQKAEEWVKHNSDESIHSFDGEQLQKAYIAGATEATKELQEELEKWKAEWQEQVQKATDEGFARTMLQIEIDKLKKQIEKMKCCGNCRCNHRCYAPCTTSQLEKWELAE